MLGCSKHYFYVKRKQLARKLSVNSIEKHNQAYACKVNEHIKYPGMTGEGRTCSKKEVMGHYSPTFLLQAHCCELTTETLYTSLI